MINDSLENAAQAVAARNVKLRTLLLRLVDPDDLGHAVSEEVRRLITQALITHKGATP